MLIEEFVAQLTLALQNKKVPLPFEDKSKPAWHQLFYRLKNYPDPDKPAFLRKLTFLWCDTYPYCQELGNVLDEFTESGTIVVGQVLGGYCLDPAEALKLTERSANEPHVQDFILKIVQMATAPFNLACS